jgi:ribosome biogenesis GTPase
LGPLDRPIVGDWVAVVEGQGRAIIHHVFQRRTAMLRRAAGTQARGQVVAANVDLFFVVTSANRDFNPRRLERYLTAVWDSGAEPVIVLNKVDLGADVDAMVDSIGVVGLGVPMVRTSARTEVGLEELRGFLAPGRTVGLVGSSGVGKSSLINRLLGRDALEVRELRDHDKGRHTTTRRELIDVPTGGMVMDTPGLREVGLIEDEVGMDASFAEIAELAEECRFRDCVHQGEPGCAVAEAVATGRIDEARLASYHKLKREIAAAERRRDPVHAGRSKRRWKSIHVAFRARTKVDPKFKP